MGKWDFLGPYDAQVQSALTAGDVKQAFEVLLQGYQGVIVQFCTTLLGNAADGEDVAQEVFEAVLRALPRYEPTALLRTWVFRIARNRCFKYREKLQHWVKILVTQRPGVSASPEALYQDALDDTRLQSRLRRLERSLHRIAKGDRALLMMYYYEELSFREMATSLRLSEATVRRAVHAAEGQLRQLLTREETRDDP
jgi:RNA polymerase sigma-70 factor (ECF subfamily)